MAVFAVADRSLTQMAIFELKSAIAAIIREDCTSALLSVSRAVDYIQARSAEKSRPSPKSDSPK